MEEVSIILKDNINITTDEFRALNNYGYTGRIWLIQFCPSGNSNFYTRFRTTEYIFDPEAFTIFSIISNNIFTYWNTQITKNIKDNEIFYISETLYLTPYRK